MRFFLGSLFQPLCTRLFNLLDLAHDKAQSRHVSTKFEKRVWRERNPLRRTQCGEAFRRFAQRRFEVSNTGSGASHPPPPALESLPCDSDLVPRNQPMKTRLSNPVSSRSVFAR